MLGTYLMALSAMSFAALSALTLISWVNRFDPPEAARTEKPAPQHEVGAAA